MDRRHQLLARRRRLVLALLTMLSARIAAHGPATASSTWPRDGDRLRVALDAAARAVDQALAALTAVAPPGTRTAFSTGTARSSFSPSLAAAAREDCVELLRDSLHLLSGARAPGAGRDDALAWLSAALTNHDTCADGLADAGLVSDDDVGVLNLNAAARGTVRDSLVMLHASFAAPDPAPAPGCNDDGGCSCRNATPPPPPDACALPRWLASTDQRLQLLLSPGDQSLKDAVDLVVAHDGTGTHATIADAVHAAPECSERRTVIHVKEGRYDEVVRVGTRKTNLVFVGDGAGRTVVTGNRSAADNITTFQTATFAASGSGFMMLDMTVENRAGPSRRQAVALRVSADRAVVHRCGVLGYQDTLYAHSGRQFYRDCDVHGTVDFVFGNAAAVLQRCALRARTPLPGQKNTVTAQNRPEPCQDTGIVLHACRVVPAPDLDGVAPSTVLTAAAPSPAPPPTYLGRPWKQYSRVVVMQSCIGSHVPPQGWLPWNASTFALDTLYYGEYMNYGPGAGVEGRVPWRGHRVISDAAEAERFTVARFIAGASWLPATGVSFGAGLSL